MSGFLLVIWTVVAQGNVPGPAPLTRHDWRSIGPFYTEAACQAAAKNLGQKPNTYRCVNQRDGSTS